MTPHVTDNAAASRFEISVDGDVVGYADYERSGSVLTLPHTVVDPEREGQGLGTALVEGLLEEVRARGEQIVPVCSFVADYLRRHPEQADLVAHGRGAPDPA